MATARENGDIQYERAPEDDASELEMPLYDEEEVVSRIRASPKPTCQPWLPHIQRLPSAYFESLIPSTRLRKLILVTAGLSWVVLFFALVHKSSFATSTGYTNIVLKNLDCGSSLWMKNNGCGVNGTDCYPFEGTSFVFKCPIGCEGSSHVLNPRAVGDYIANYQSFVIGGPSTSSSTSNIYRGDSFICASAIHAGLFPSSTGGCALLNTVGSSSNFPSSTRNAITSISFDSSFPLSYTLSPASGSSGCTSHPLPILLLNLLLTLLTCLLTPQLIPLTHTFSILFLSTFLHVSLVSDPFPPFPTPLSTLTHSLTVLLPACFVAYVIYAKIFAPTFSSFPAPLELALLYLLPLWLTALSRDTIEPYIPLQRLTVHDIKQQPGALIALLLIVGLLALVVIAQALTLHRHRLLVPTLRIYLLLLLGLAGLGLVRGTQLRIHHYILALLLMPGVRFQTRPSMVYQALLLGLFVAGVARWGFDGILQTPGALLGDGLRGGLMPALSEPALAGGAWRVRWNGTLPLADELDGAERVVWDRVSLLVNDVEVYRGTGDAFDVELGDEGVEKWYVRAGYVGAGKVGDYTSAMAVFRNGSWVKGSGERT